MEEAVAAEDTVTKEVKEATPTLEYGPGRMSLLLLAFHGP